jgi:hypothetical protein
MRIYEEAGIIRCGHNVRIVSYHPGRDMPGFQTARTFDPISSTLICMKAPGSEDSLKRDWAFL